MFLTHLTKRKMNKSQQTGNGNGSKVTEMTLNFHLIIRKLRGGAFVFCFAKHFNLRLDNSMSGCKNRDSVLVKWNKRDDLRRRSSPYVSLLSVLLFCILWKHLSYSISCKKLCDSCILPMNFQNIYRSNHNWQIAILWSKIGILWAKMNHLKRV